MEFVICNKWELAFDVKFPEHLGARHDRPYYYYVQRKPQDLALNLYCMEQMAARISGPVDSVIDYFGGLGCVSLICKQMFHPSVQVVADIDPTCCAILRQVHPDLEVVNCDFYEYAGTSGQEFDLALFDFETMTALQLSRIGMEVFKRTLATGSWGIFTDTAVAKFHLNRGLYEDLFEVTLGDIDSYYAEFSRFFSENFGWHFPAVAHHNRAAYILMKAGKAPPGSVPEVEKVEAEGEPLTYFRMKGLLDL